MERVEPAPAAPDRRDHGPPGRPKSTHSSSNAQTPRSASQQISPGRHGTLEAVRYHDATDPGPPPDPNGDPLFGGLSLGARHGVTAE